MRASRPFALLLAADLASGVAHADTAPFDLTGPTLRVTVTHRGATLPIAEVPQLAVGDTVKVRADLPQDQSAHYVLVAAFLRGSTNPPPDKWFAQAEAWTKKGRKGLTLTVPDGAQQVALFLAPATGGDYPTLRNAVQGRPGAFVRAAQDLAQASLDHARMETYLAAVRQADPGDPERLKRVTPLLARSLQVKVNTDCLSRLPDLQAACLLQNQESLVLNDGHTNAITDAMAGPGTDLALQLSATPQGGLGYYSPYIAAIRDIIGILGSLHTAKYQYIPALARFDGDRMALVLNAPPSFHNPKSVLVTALPVIAPVHVPPLQLADPAATLCAGAPTSLVPVVGAPLIYATNYAHDLALHVTLPGGRVVDLPATPDAERGGLVIAGAGRLPNDIKTPLDGTLRGKWGFQPFDGPRIRLMPGQAAAWRAAPGADGKLALAGGSAACVTGVAVRSGGGEPRALEWDVAGPDRILFSAPPADTAGSVIEIAGPPGTTPSQVALAGPAAAPRFVATLIARDARRPQAATPVSVRLADDGEIADDATLSFSLRAGQGHRFSGREKIEVAAGSGGGTATLGVGNGVTLADPEVAVATIQPGRALGPSAFGPLRARIVSDGTPGDWLPLGTLVRLPLLHGLSCPSDPGQPCDLSGEGLFLLSAISATPGFEQPVSVPDGYPGTAIRVPHPNGGPLHVRLHDDPDATGATIG